MEPYLSVVVPAFNEEARLAPSLDHIVEYLKRQSYPVEVIVVDDGSTDQTAQVASAHLKEIRHVVLKNEKNRGKGYSVRRGMLEAKGEYVLFSDADLSTPIEEVEGFLKHLADGYDVVIGSRGMEDSNVEIHQNFLRELMGKIFNRIASALAFKGIRDSQCGFKAFTRSAAQQLFGAQKLDGFSFDVEILYLAQRAGLRILETGVTWRNSAASRVQLVADPFRMFADLFRIRWLHRN